MSGDRGSSRHYTSSNPFKDAPYPVTYSHKTLTDHDMELVCFLQHTFRQCIDCGMQIFFLSVFRYSSILFLVFFLVAGFTPVQLLLQCNWHGFLSFMLLLVSQIMYAPWSKDCFNYIFAACAGHLLAGLF